MRIVFDTSALLSLAAGGILELVAEHVYCVIPTKVEEELLRISLRSTFEGNLAKQVLVHIGEEIEIISTSWEYDGETACARLAQSLQDVAFLVTDDTLAVSRIQKLCDKSLLFSPHIVHMLYVFGILTQQQAISVLERMCIKRDWKHNILYVQAQGLFRGFRPF